MRKTKADKMYVMHQYILDNEQIYKTVPKYLKLTRMSAKARFIKRQEIKKFIKSHKGRKNAVPLNKISAELKFDPIGNCGEFRFLATKVLEEENFPIVTCEKGYFYPTKVEEVLENIDNIDAKIKGLHRRAIALRKVAIREFDDYEFSAPRKKREKDKTIQTKLPL